MTTTKTPRISPATNNHNGHLDRPRVVRDIAAWMRKNCPAEGVDRLATRPAEFTRMAIHVASLHTSVPTESFARVASALRVLREELPDVFQAVDRICRTAMNARKQGKLHPHAPSPATKAAQTRKNGAK